jgi:hypothetical protein
VTIRIPVREPQPDGNAPHPAHEPRRRLRRAAHRARHLYPGALGELVALELTICTELGCALAPDGLVWTLAEEILAAEEDAFAVALEKGRGDRPSVSRAPPPGEPHMTMAAWQILLARSASSCC